MVLDRYAMVEESHWVGNRVEYRLIPSRALEVLCPEGTDSLLVSVTVQF
ncbi:MAG: hypothetical protein H0W54_04780 [Rubrobacter sp.]|nr:hypothetical protein [Rubrobacter sp.]